MKIFIEREKKTLKKNFKGKVQDLLLLLDINPNNVLVVKEDELMTEDDDLSNNDFVKILSVISVG